MGTCKIFSCLFCEKLVNRAKSLWLYVQVCLTSVMPWRGHYSWLISLRLFSSACGCLWKDFGPDSAAFLLKMWLSVDLCVSVCQKNQNSQQCICFKSGGKETFPSSASITRKGDSVKQSYRQHVTFMVTEAYVVHRQGCCENIRGECTFVYVLQVLACEVWLELLYKLEGNPSEAVVPPNA